MESNFNKNLYKRLLELRENIKESERKATGRAPAVCTDTTLCKIAELVPQELDDFIAIEGIGKAFTEKYAQLFLNVILSFNPDSQKTFSVNEKLMDTLKELEKRLVNINKRNRLLCLAKQSRKFAYDLFDENINNKLLELLFSQSNKKVRICDINNSCNKEKEQIKYRKLSILIREANILLREKGQSDLYIGYPFVIGKMIGADFPTRAPLVLFPISIEREPSYISISIDINKDIFYNNTLILAHNKFNEVNNALPDNEIEGINKETFIKSIIDYYDKEKIALSTKSEELTSFVDYNSKEFPEFNEGELYIENNIVLGNFPVYSSCLQKDFNTLLDKSMANKLLIKLLDDFEDTNFLADTDYNNNTEDLKQLDISEEKLSYINDLNSSQENVLVRIKEDDLLVVQGPPGTGKSQTITSVIADALLENKTVLMVSEKKTALEVIYSRLGELSCYALLLDDTKNKSLFYNQLQTMFRNQEESTPNSKLSSIANKVDANIQKLESIASSLYDTTDFGIEMYKLFRENKKIDFSNDQEMMRCSTIKKELHPTIYSWDYEKLNQVKQVFDSESQVAKLEWFFDYRNGNRYIEKLRTDLNEFDIMDYKNTLKALRNQKSEWNDFGKIKQLFTKGKLKKEIIKFCNNFFKQIDSFEEDIFKNLDDTALNLSAEEYNQYFLNKALYEKLSADEKLYLNNIYAIKPQIEMSLIETNDYVYNYILYVVISRFKNQNREALNNVDNFDDIIKDIVELISKKKYLTRDKVVDYLNDEFSKYVIKSKRFLEMKRKAESKRKTSVHKYIDKYDFELFRGIKIWLLTPEVVSEILPMKCGLFDIVIFDEASQMFIENGVPAIFRAKKVMIVGDNKQLRPNSVGKGRYTHQDESDESHDDAALEEESLLDLARFKCRPIMLNYHYRSKYEELIAFSNYAFYNTGLYISPNSKAPDRPPIEVVKVENGMWIHTCNKQEGDQIVQELKQFFADRRHNETIGIITFNSKQRDLIIDLIEEECKVDKEFAIQIKQETNRKDDGQDIGLFIKNIENVQGDERDVILFSVGYAKNESGRVLSSFGSLNQKGGGNRLNVAISRARKKVKIITSIDPSELMVSNTKNEGPKLLKKYLEYADCISSGDKKSAQEVLKSLHDDGLRGKNRGFDSDFENQVCDMLVMEGYTVEPQVGIGGYQIDLAIVNKETKDYVLGIECDGKLYHSSKSARERDLYRQRYLESRGWSIHRIWSTNWWHNPGGEIKKIVSVVDSLMNK